MAELPGLYNLRVWGQIGGTKGDGIFDTYFVDGRVMQRHKKIFTGGPM
jgi:hypothetical protein